MPKRIAAAVLAVVIAAACSGATSTRTPTEMPATTPTAAPAEAPTEALGGSLEPGREVEQACADADPELIEQCIELMTFVTETLPGDLVAICEYVDGTIDVVYDLDRESDAEDECATAGEAAVERVVATVRLPE